MVGENCELVNDDDFWQVREPADKLFYGRFLDTAYLSPSTEILMWSDDENVHIEWDNREKLFAGKLAWTASVGSFRTSREQFLAEVDSFHRRLIEQMSSRIADVEAGVISSEIKIDVSGLRAEHQQRQMMYESALKVIPATPWDEVEQALEVIGQSSE